MTVPDGVTIDYNKLADAHSFYISRGYNFITAPWFVSRKAMEMTAPPGRRFCTSFLGDLVASGEQSFIQLWLDKSITGGKWHCITPCFRDEPVVDEIHHNYFMKLELIDLMPNSDSLEKMIEDAVQFFRRYLRKVDVIDTEIGKDVVYDGLELGSYGYREFGEMKWVYGTGCAEPRLSQAEMKWEF